VAEIPADSPYPLGTLVRDPRLLQIREPEIAMALEALAPEEGERSHVVLLGEAHSGRSSVLVEVSRRLAHERGRLVVVLTRPEALAPERQAFIRHLLIALVEALSEAIGPAAPWYEAWRERVYLRSKASVGAGDLLSSALFLAADPGCEVDQAVLQRDLAVLLEIASEAGFKGIVFSIDDASPLTEDVALIEELVDCFDLLGGYSLLIAALPSTAGHFTEAASNCLRRFCPVRLVRLLGPQRIHTALTAPLPVADRALVKEEYDDLLRDVRQLTGGNVYELMIVAHHLWMSCKLGEQDKFTLTPRVLDRIIPHIALLTAEGDALRDGAEAIDLLPEDRVAEAVELASFSRLSVREIAITRLLGIGRVESACEKAITPAEIEVEGARVRSSLEELEEAGVVSLHPDGQRFALVGGRAVAVLLKYKARARVGAAALEIGFDLGFLRSVGQYLACQSVTRWLDALPDGRSLGLNASTPKGAIGRHSPRPAIRALVGGGEVDRLIEAELDFAPWNEEAYDRIAALLAEEDPVVALVCTSVMYEGDQLEYMEAWELEAGVDQAALDRTLAEVTNESWVEVVESADLTWSGSEGAVLRGAKAREALIALFHIAAGRAVHELFRFWLSGGGTEPLGRARRVAAEAVTTLRKTGRSDLVLHGELAGMLSRLGFLQSFEDGLLGEARVSLEEALRVGAGDGWVTRWNYVNVLGRSGEVDAAIAQLDLLEEEYGGSERMGYVFFFLPGRPTEESFVKIDGLGIGALFDLQRVILHGGSGTALQAALQACLESGDEGAEAVAGWVEPPAVAAA
jgi:hypothetical protein